MSNDSVPRWRNDCGHALTSFYAIKPADPHGEAVFGEHFGCQECDAAIGGAHDPDTDIQARLERLRGAIRAENISYGEIAELVDLAEHIDPSDVELLEWAGVPEFPEDEPEWHVSVIVPVLVRGGTEDQALQAAVRHVNDGFYKESNLDADYEPHQADRESGGQREAGRRRH